MREARPFLRWSRGAKMNNKVIPAGEASRIIGISRQRLRVIALNNELEFIETPLGRLFFRDQVEHYAQRRRERLGAAEVV
jgi:hypothetical protein